MSEEETLLTNLCTIWYVQETHPSATRQIANKPNLATSNPLNTGVPDAQHAHAPSPARAATNYGRSALASATRPRTCAATN